MEVHELKVLAMGKAVDKPGWYDKLNLKKRLKKQFYADGRKLWGIYW